MPVDAVNTAGMNHQGEGVSKRRTSSPQERPSIIASGQKQFMRRLPKTTSREPSSALFNISTQVSGERGRRRALERDLNPPPRLVSRKRRRDDSRETFTRGSNAVTKRPRRTSLSSTDQLCKECSCICWDAIDALLKSRKRISWRGLPLVDVGKRYRQVSSSNPCTLCQQLYAPWIEGFLENRKYVKGEKIDTGDRIHVFPNLRLLYHVNDFPASRDALRTHEAPYHIAVVPIAPAWRRELKRHIAARGMVVVLPQGHTESRILQPQQVARKFDAEIVQSWLQVCRRHRKLCNPETPEVYGMRVIDCESEDLAIRDYHTTDKYVALSYVWGSPGQSEAPNLPRGNGQAQQQVIAAGIKQAAPLPGSRILEHIHRSKPGPDQERSGLRQDSIGAVAVARLAAAAIAPSARSVLKLPNNIPLTILDAIEVTKALEYRYLWVDKYCIDQSNEAEKQAQFSRMGDIYAGAQVTILALGENSNAGLPGVSSTPRLNQRICTIGRYRFISTMPDPHEAIKRSRWSTRAWTYQEGLFSTRRLFFTNHQMYFECNAMNCAESFKSNLSILHVNSGQRFRAYHRAGQFVCGNSNHFSHLNVKRSQANHRKVDIIRRCQMQVQRYTKRELTDKDDILNAFQGIARFYAKTTAMIASLAGIPIPFPIAHLPNIEPEGLGNLSYALAWSHGIDNFDNDFPRRFKQNRQVEEKVGKPLKPLGDSKPESPRRPLELRREQLPWTPYDNPKPQRRAGFPSWSWAGWFGVLKKRKDLPYCWTSLLSSVRIEFPNGEMKDYAWLHGFSRYKQYLIRKLLTARSLHFDAYVLNPEKLRFWENPDGPSGRRPLSGIYVHLSTGPRSLEKLHEKLMKRELECVVLGTYGEPRGEVFRAIQAADKKRPEAKKRRIDLFERGEPDVVTCLIVYTVKGVSYRSGLLRLQYNGAGGESAIQAWDPGPKRRFILM